MPGGLHRVGSRQGGLPHKVGGESFLVGAVLSNFLKACASPTTRTCPGTPSRSHFTSLLFLPLKVTPTDTNHQNEGLGQGSKAKPQRPQTPRLNVPHAEAWQRGALVYPTRKPRLQGKSTPSPLSQSLAPTLHVLCLILG